MRGTGGYMALWGKEIKVVKWFQDLMENSDAINKLRDVSKENLF